MRRFYTLTFHEDKRLQTVSEDETDDFDITTFWQGKPFQGEIPQSVKIFVDEGEPSDYLANPIGWPIVSQRCLEHIQRLSPNDIQVFPAPLYHESTQSRLPGYYIINLLRVVDALVEILDFEGKTVLKESLIPEDAHFFTTPKHLTTHFVSHAMYDELHKERLRGFAYIRTTLVQGCEIGHSCDGSLCDLSKDGEIMPDHGKESVPRRSFLKVAGAVMAAIGGFSLNDIVQAEARNPIVDPSNIDLGMDVRSATEIQRIATKYYADEQWYLRLGVQGNENIGYQVCMGIDQDPVEGEDITASVQQVPLVVQRDCLRILSGTRIVFGERSGQRGFIFEGPLFDRSSRKG